LATGEVRCAWIGLVKQHWGEALAHVPLQIIGQHAEQDVARTRGAVQRNTGRSSRSTVFSERKACSTPLSFVGAHRGSGIAVSGWQVGADHIDAVERGLGGDAEGVLGEAEPVIGDADLEMLGHAAPSSTAPIGGLFKVEDLGPQAVASSDRLSSIRYPL
jgi:hypothetical protein